MVEVAHVTPPRLQQRKFQDPDHYVIKLKFEKFDEFSELIVSNLTRLLDLPGAELDILRGESSVLKDTGNKLVKSWNKMKKKETKCSSLNPVLSDQCLAQMQQLTDFLSTNLSMEGLFRKPGNALRQNQLITALSTGACIDFSKSPFQPHDAASVLKTFLGQLSEPLLLPSKHFYAHKQIASMMKVDPTTQQATLVDKPKRIETLQLLLLLLPTNHRNVLRAIMNLLYETAKNQAENKMNAANLSAMFAPHLIWPKNAKSSDIHDWVAKLNEHVAFMIRHSQKLFVAPQYVRDAADAFYHVGSAAENTMSPQVSSTLLVAPSSAVKRTASARLNYNTRAKAQTENAINHLFEQVHSMPDSAKKKKLVKNFDKHNEVLQYKDKARRRHRTFSGFLRKKHPALSLKRAKDSYRQLAPEDLSSSRTLPKPDLLVHCGGDDTRSLNTEIKRKNFNAVSHVSLPESLAKSCVPECRSPGLAAAIPKQLRLLQQRRSASPALKQPRAKEAVENGKSTPLPSKVSTV